MQCKDPADKVKSLGPGTDQKSVFPIDGTKLRLPIKTSSTTPYRTIRSITNGKRATPHVARGRGKLPLQVVPKLLLVAGRKRGISTARVRPRLATKLRGHHLLLSIRQGKSYFPVHLLVFRSTSFLRQIWEPFVFGLTQCLARTGVAQHTPSTLNDGVGIICGQNFFLLFGNLHVSRVNPADGGAEAT